MFDFGQNLDDPKNLALLYAAAGLLQGGQGKANFGQDLSRGLLGGLQGYGQGKAMQAKLAEEQQQRQMRDMQMQQMKGLLGEQDAMRNLAQTSFAPGSAPSVPNDDNGNQMPNVGAGGGFPAYAQGMARINPQLALQLQSQLAQMQQRERVKLGEGEKLFDVGTGKSVAENPRQEGPKKGQVREVMSGERTLQYEWDGQKWNKIGEGPRFKPETAPAPQLYDSPTGPMWVSPPAKGAPNQVVTGPDNKAIPAKKRDQPLTEAQGNATAYAMRAVQSEEMLQQIEKGGFNPAAFPGIRNRMAGTQLNVLAPDAAQQYNAAKKNFVTAVLRKESGAAISNTEFENEDQKYFPQPGDGPVVRAQKQKARALAIEALKVQAGPGASKAGASGGWGIRALD